jgi:hypothetical protein
LTYVQIFIALAIFAFSQGHRKLDGLLFFRIPYPKAIWSISAKTYMNPAVIVPYNTHVDCMEELYIFGPDGVDCIAVSTDPRHQPIPPNSLPTE